MKLRQCPRCESIAYDKIGSFYVCYDCNFNTVENYSWTTNHHDSTNLKPISLIPGLSEAQSHTVCEKIFRAFSLESIPTRTDRMRIWRLIEMFPVVERQILILIMVENLPLTSIGVQLNIPDNEIIPLAKKVLSNFKQRYFE